MVTSWLQSLYYGITIRAGTPHPQPGSPRFVSHRRRIHILVIASYLLYTIYEADHLIRSSPNHYSILSLPAAATPAEIKSRFRRLAAIHHPDKTNDQDYFLVLKTAQDTLLHPTRRFAYERLGPVSASWRNVSSIRDYVLQGVQSIIAHYVVGAVAMYVLGKLGFLAFGVYWRWLSFLALGVFELHVVTRPYAPWFGTHILNPVMALAGRDAYLPYQIIELARKVSITGYIAMSQLGPLLQSPAAARAAADPDAAVKMQLERLEGLVTIVDGEASRGVGMEMAPFVGEGEHMLSKLRGAVREWLVQNTVRSDPEVRDAVGRAMRRRREGAPSGARGTR